MLLLMLSACAAPDALSVLLPAIEDALRHDDAHAVAWEIYVPPLEVPEVVITHGDCRALADETELRCRLRFKGDRCAVEVDYLSEDPAICSLRVWTRDRADEVVSLWSFDLEGTWGKDGPALCGNGQLDEGEECDPGIPGSQGCLDHCQWNRAQRGRAAEGEEPAIAAQLIATRLAESGLATLPSDGWQRHAIQLYSPSSVERHYSSLSDVRDTLDDTIWQICEELTGRWVARSCTATVDGADGGVELRFWMTFGVHESDDAVPTPGIPLVMALRME